MRHFLVFCRDESGASKVEFGLAVSGFALTYFLLKGVAIRRLRVLRNENRRLKKLLAESMLDAHALKEARGKA